MTEARDGDSNASPRGQHPRPAPAPDRLTQPFWSALAEGALKIQRCPQCDARFHPPVGMCPACLNCELEFTEVSGRATLYSFTLTRSGARQPAFRERLPYIVALAELAEQPGLLMFCNLPEIAPEKLRVGMPLRFYPDPREEDVVVPEFRAAEPHAEERGRSGW
jgi:uncharacterized OB-fold protein